MSDGRKNNGGTKGNKGGGLTYGKMAFIKNNVIKHSKEWWLEWAKMMNSKKKDTTDKKFAMAEFNKLQTKMIPQKLEDDDGNAVSPVLVTFLNEKPTDNNRNTK